MKRLPLDFSEKLGFRPRQFKKAFVRRYLMPRGYGEWQPLIVDEQAFKDAVSGALDRLLRVERASGLGDYLEFGVSRGTSMVCVHDVLQAKGLRDIRLIGFEWIPRAAPGGCRRRLDPGCPCLDRSGDAAILERPRGGPRSGHVGQGLVPQHFE